MKITQVKLDILFSKFIRLRDTDDLGYGNCITCNKPFHYYDLECGHFRKRGNLCTRWNENNAHAQCVECNRKDDFVMYMSVMIGKYGSDVPAEIIKMSKDECKTSQAALQGLYNYFRDQDKCCIGFFLYKVVILTVSREHAWNE